MNNVKKCAWTLCGAFRNRYLSFVFRIAIGVVFIVSGAGKLPELAEFVDEVKGADVLPDALASVYGHALPFVEIVIGVLLVLGLFTRFAAAIGGLSSISFMIGNGFRIHRGYYGDCECFGTIAALQFSTWNALTIDCVMLIAAIQIMVHKGEFLSLDSVIFRRKTPAAG